MTRSKRMQSVAGIAKNKEKDAARVLAEKRKILEQQRQRLLELVNYREEYTEKFQTSGSQGFNSRQLNEYRIFLDKLNMAIVQQGDRINQLVGECHVCQDNWFATRTSSKALDKVVERYKNEELQLQEEREQKDLDERAMRLRPSLFDD